MRRAADRAAAIAASLKLSDIATVILSSQEDNRGDTKRFARIQWLIIHGRMDGNILSPLAV